VSKTFARIDERSIELKPERIKSLFVPAYLLHVSDLKFALQEGE